MQVNDERFSKQSVLRDQDSKDTLSKKDPVDSKRYRLLFKDGTSRPTLVIPNVVQAFVKQMDPALLDRMAMRGIAEGFVIATDDKAVFEGLMSAEFETMLNETCRKHGHQRVTIAEFPREETSRMSMREMIAVSITKVPLKAI